MSLLAQGLLKFPVTQRETLWPRHLLDRLAQERQKHLPAQLTEGFRLSRATLSMHIKIQAAALLRRMIALQEELDWRCYQLYGFTDADLCYMTTALHRLPEAGPARLRDRHGPQDGRW